MDISYALRGAALVACCAGAALAQDEQPTREELQREMEELRERLDAIERSIEDQDEAPAQATDFALPVGALPPSGSTSLGQGNLFNPSLTFFFDMGASVSTDGNDDRFNRFNLREIEMDARAPIAPFADGVFILAIGEEIEEEADGFERETHIDVEEGYIHFHTLPWDMSVKGGKFRNSFGRSNILHTHDLPQVSRPLAVQAFLGPEGLATVGANADWLVPNPWDKYIEFTAEVVNADGGEESPILGGGVGADDPAFLGHIKLFDELGPNADFEIGGSYMYAHTSDDSEFDANVFGLDATYTWRDPEAPNAKSLLVQGELLYAKNDVDDPGGAFRNESTGAYAFVQRQWSPNWYAGVRGDYTEFPSSESRGRSDEDWAVSAYVSYYATEFLRFRVEYQHIEQQTDNNWDSEDNLFFAITFSFGAHPPHPYWVNR